MPGVLLAVRAVRGGRPDHRWTPCSAGVPGAPVGPARVSGGGRGPGPVEADLPQGPAPLQAADGAVRLPAGSGVEQPVAWSGSAIQPCRAPRRPQAAASRGHTGRVPLRPHRGSHNALISPQAPRPVGRLRRGRGRPVLCVGGFCHRWRQKPTVCVPRRHQHMARRRRGDPPSPRPSGAGPVDHLHRAGRHQLGVCPPCHGLYAHGSRRFGHGSHCTAARPCRMDTARRRAVRPGDPRNRREQPVVGYATSGGWSVPSSLRSPPDRRMLSCWRSASSTCLWIHLRHSDRASVAPLLLVWCGSWSGACSARVLATAGRGRSG